MPALSFEIREASVRVLHEVPIRIVSDPKETAIYTEPPIGDDSDSAVAVIFPAGEFKGLKNVVERMRTVTEWMQLTASHSASPLTGGGDHGEVDGNGIAELELLVDKPELVKIKTTYPRLGMPASAPEPGAEGDDAPEHCAVPSGDCASAPVPTLARRACASVEVKKLLRILQSLSASALQPT